MGNLIRASLVAPLVAIIAALGVGLFGNATPAFAWNLSAQCQDSGHVSGVLDIPSSDSGTYTVFVEYRTGAYNWAWVQGAGANVTAGSKNFTMDVSQTPENAVSLRVRYKDAQGVYGAEISGEFVPCGNKLHVFDLQAECTDVDLRIYGGMIGVPEDAGLFPWTVFMEYQDPATSIPYIEDWHWVGGTGVKVGSEHRGSNVNFEFRDPPILSGVTELRIRYKAGESSPWIYGSEISRIFSPCRAAPTATPTKTSTPVAPTSTSVPPTAVQPASTATTAAPCSCIKAPNTGTGGYLNQDEGRGKGYFIGYGLAALVIGLAAMGIYTVFFWPAERRA